MRTTLNLDDDVAKLVADYADSRSLSLGKAASEIIRRGLTITGEILFGVEEQSNEEIGEILRRGRENLALLAARQRALRRALESELERARTLKAEVDACVAHEKERLAALNQPQEAAS